jgi:hypothetical protein
MTAIVLPDIDRSTLQDLKDRMPSLKLSEIEFPKIEKVGREADKALDRLLGREKNPVWPWVAAGIGLVTILGIGAALLSWSRRSAWSMPGSSGSSTGFRAGAETGTDVSVTDIYGDTTTGPNTGDIGTSSGLGVNDDWGSDLRRGTGSADGSGLTAAESSLTSSLEGNQP